MSCKRTWAMEICFGITLAQVVMAELDTNVSALRPRAGDPTNALRQRRHRKRKARSTVTAPARRGKITHAEKLNDIKSNVTVSVDRWNAADVTTGTAAIWG